MADRNASPKPVDRKPKSKGLLKEQLELVRTKSTDGKTRYTIKPIDDTLEFEKGFFVVIRALQLLKDSNPGVVVIGVAGPSGAGKTAFTERVKNLIPGVAVIPMDMYNDGTKVIDENFDDPRLTDYDLLLQNLADLRDGKTVKIPIYDFRQSKRVGYREQPRPDSRIVLVEGIYALSERLRPLMDLRVSITGGVHFDLVKRVMRDIQRSGQGPEEIIQQISDTVYPMYKAFIEPDLQTAHLKIVNSFNPFSGFMKPTYILKSKTVPDEVAVKEVLEAHGTVTQRKDVDIYDIYLLPPNEDPETCASWLRMRNREGRYSLMFEETVVEGNFIISPRISFEVNVRILGGLMALGYQIGTIMRRTSKVLAVQGADDLQVKLDEITNLGRFIQVLGRDREQVAAVAKALGLDAFVPRSYIEQVQLEKLTAEFQTVTEDWKKVFSTRSGEVVMPDSVSGHSPGFSRSVSYHGGTPSNQLQLSTSAPISSPIAIANSINSRPGSRAGSVAGPGLLSQQLAANGAAASPHIDSSMTFNDRVNGLSAASRSRSTVDLAALAVVQERVERLAGGLQGLGALREQVEAMMGQHRETNMQLQQLTEASRLLASSLQASLASSGGAVARPAAAQAAPGGTSVFVLGAAAVGAAAVLGAAAGFALSRWQRMS